MIVIICLKIYTCLWGCLYRHCFVRSNFWFLIIDIRNCLIRFFTFIAQDYVNETIILPIFRIKYFTFLSFNNLWLTLTKQFKKRNFTWPKEKLILYIKNIDCDVSIFKIFTQFQIFIRYFGHRWINIESHLSNFLMEWSSNWFTNIAFSNITLL